MQQQSDPKDPDRAPPGPATHQSNSTAKDGSPRPHEGADETSDGDA